MQYETLATEPVTALAAIYDFLGEAPLKHDFPQVDFDASTFDQKAGTPGLHHVRPRIAAIGRATILPPDLLRCFENDGLWRDPQLHPQGVHIV